MKEEIRKRECYWVVEATSKGKVIFFKEYTHFEPAWDKYYSFKGRASVMLQRKFREVSVVM